MTQKPSSLIALAGLVAIVAIAFAAPAAAQERTAQAYQTEFSAQYSLLRDVGRTGNGMAIDFGHQIKPNLSLIGEVAFNHFSHWDETYNQFAGGVRYGMLKNRFRPFAQVLVGVQRDFGISGFNVQPGGGVNLRIANRFDAKFQVDLPIVQWDGDSYKQFRFSFGIGIPLGGK